MPPKKPVSTKTKAKYKKMLRKAENAALTQKMETLRLAMFDDTGADRDLLADFAAFKTFKRNGLDVSLHFYSASALPSELKTAVFDLTKANMHDVYVEAGWGWSDSKKKAEMFDDAGRYIVAMGKPTAGSGATAPATAGAGDATATAATSAGESVSDAPVRRCCFTELSYSAFPRDLLPRHNHA
jgi:hypothetical protein